MEFKPAILDFIEEWIYYEHGFLDYWLINMSTSIQRHIRGLLTGLTMVATLSQASLRLHMDNKSGRPLSVTYTISHQDGVKLKKTVQIPANKTYPINITTGATGRGRTKVLIQYGTERELEFSVDTRFDDIVQKYTNITLDDKSITTSEILQGAAKGKDLIDPGKQRKTHKIYPSS